MGRGMVLLKDDFEDALRRKQLDGLKGMKRGTGTHPAILKLCDLEAPNAACVHSCPFLFIGLRYRVLWMSRQQLHVVLNAGYCGKDLSLNSEASKALSICHPLPLYQEGGL